jgi:secreted PhoX family phosphatase
MEVGELRDGGTLHMLKVKGVTNAHLEGNQVPDTEYDVEWVEIAEPDVHYPYTPGVVAPTSNNTALVHVSSQGWAQGAAYFSRLEGQIFSKGNVFFTSTQGGGAQEATSTAGDAGGFGNGSGQVWCYDPRAERLRVVFQSPDSHTLDLPDNITTSNRGTLVVCEDNVNDNFIRGLSPEGDLWNIALNRLTSSTGVDRSNDEFAGTTFSHTGQTLFVNIQSSAGMTFAIWGPWGSIGV